MDVQMRRVRRHLGRYNGAAMSVSREKLYEEVWLEPMTTVAQRYDVSSSFLARVCEHMGVPRPSRGYWAQRAAGIEVEHEELPPTDPMRIPPIMITEFAAS
jgi:hypothetical protein